MQSQVLQKHSKVFPDEPSAMEVASVRGQGWGMDKAPCNSWSELSGGVEGGGEGVVGTETPGAKIGAAGQGG